MINCKSLVAAAALSFALTSVAFAARVETAQVPHHPVHKHHVAKNVKPNTASDVNTDSDAYVVKRQSDPEYFSHASGSDGSVPSE